MGSMAVPACKHQQQRRGDGAAVGRDAPRSSTSAAAAASVSATGDGRKPTSGDARSSGTARAESAFTASPATPRMASLALSSCTHWCVSSGRVTPAARNARTESEQPTAAGQSYTSKCSREAGQ